MRVIGGFKFPETAAEAKAWEPTVSVYALAARVLAVATTRVEGCWRAYCDAVPGARHDEEWPAVREYGCALPEAVARAVFPSFAGLPYST